MRALAKALYFGLALGFPSACALPDAPPPFNGAGAGGLGATGGTDGAGSSAGGTTGTTGGTTATGGTTPTGGTTSTGGTTAGSTATGGSAGNASGGSSGAQGGGGTGGTATGGSGGASGGRGGTPSGGAGAGGRAAGGAGAGGRASGGGGAGGGGRAAGGGGAGGMMGAIVELARGRTATADSEENNTTSNPPKVNLAPNANDGSATTRWCAANGGQHYWQVDLGASHPLSRVEIDFEYPTQAAGTSYGFVIGVSPDGTTFTTALDQTTNTSTTMMQTATLPGGTSGRYVRITVIPPTTTPNPTWSSFFEARVYGQ